MKILLVDDQEANTSVRRLLVTEIGVTFLEARSARDVLYLARRRRPNLIVLDLNSSAFSGFELLCRLVSANRAVRVLILATHSAPFYAARYLKAGALGYVSERVGAAELVTAVQRTAKGEHYVEYEIATQLAMGSTSSQSPMDQLTNRDVDMLRLLKGGLSYSEIASNLCLSSKSVVESCNRIKKAFDVSL